MKWAPDCARVSAYAAGECELGVWLESGVMTVCLVVCCRAWVDGCDEWVGVGGGCQVAVRVHKKSLLRQS